MSNKMQQHDDGSYTIDYDDGEKEIKVSPSLIRLLGAPLTLSGEEIRGSRVTSHEVWWQVFWAVVAD